MRELFSTLRALADLPEERTRGDQPRRFVILDSASPQLIRQASEWLAGRVEFIELSVFDLLETSSISLERLWLRGGFACAYLADSEGDSLAWHEVFIGTFLERTSHSAVSTSQSQLCVVSGPCWRITTVKPGMPPN
jgi:predicted AAA+ superfamily ATPase